MNEFWENLTPLDSSHLEVFLEIFWNFFIFLNSNLNFEFEPVWYRPKPEPNWTGQTGPVPTGFVNPAGDQHGKSARWDGWCTWYIVWFRREALQERIWIYCFREMVKNVKESKTKCANLRTSFGSCIHGMDDLVVYLHCFCILPLSRLKSRSGTGIASQVWFPSDS